ELAVSQMRQLGFVVRDPEVQIGFARQEEHLRADRVQRRRQITLVEVVAADVCLRPRDGLRVQVRRLASAERVLPVGLQEGLKVRSAKRGLVQALPIEVLAESPCGVDVRERAQCSLRLSAEPAVALVLRRSLKRAQQARQEHLVVPGGSGAPAYYDR